MDKLNRALQRQILEQLKAVYPDSVYGENWPDAENPEVFTNLVYLSEHGLATIETGRTINGPQVDEARITAAGLDFLEDDGGLTAILGTVTVRLDDHTLRTLIGNAIEQADAPPEEKSQLLKQVQSLPADILKSVTLRAVNEGLSKMPDVIRWLQTTIHSSSGI